MNSRREKLYPNMSDEVSEAINLLLSSDVFPTGRVKENRFEVAHTRFKFVGGDGGWWWCKRLRSTIGILARRCLGLQREHPLPFFSLIQLSESRNKEGKKGLAGCVSPIRLVLLGRNSVA